MSNLVNSNLGRTPKPSSLIQDRSCHSGRLQIAPSNLTDVFIGLQIIIYEIHFFYILNKWSNHLSKLGWGWIWLNGLLGYGSGWYGSSQTWSNKSVRCLSESVFEAIKHALGRSHVMTESMSVSEIRENRMSIPEYASNMGSDTNSCPNLCPCPFISDSFYHFTSRLFGNWTIWTF